MKNHKRVFEDCIILVVHPSFYFFSSDSGDQDMATAYVGSLAWITRLNLPVVDSWKPWFTKDQIAG